MSESIRFEPVMRVFLDDVTVGMYETSARPRGKWKTSWVMQLKRKPGACKLPRGFARRLPKVKTEIVVWLSNKESY